MRTFEVTRSTFFFFYGSKDVADDSFSSIKRTTHLSHSLTSIGVVCCRRACCGCRSCRCRWGGRGHGGGRSAGVGCRGGWQGSGGYIASRQRGLDRLRDAITTHCLVEIVQIQRPDEHSTKVLGHGILCLQIRRIMNE